MLLIIKLFGAILIAGSAFAIGYKTKGQYIKRTSFLRNMQECVKYADDRIVIENMLLEDVLRNCSNKYFNEDKGNDIWNKTLDNLNADYASFESAWEKACEDFFEDVGFLKEKDFDVIKDIGKAIGIVNTQRQSIHIKGVVDDLDRLESEAANLMEKEGKNVIPISLAVAAGIILILI